MPQYLSEGKTWQVVTLGTWGCIQAQLATEFHTTQSNGKLCKKNTIITGEVKTQLKRLYRQHTGTHWHTMWA